MRVSSFVLSVIVLTFFTVTTQAQTTPSQSRNAQISPSALSKQIQKAVKKAKQRRVNAKCVYCGEEIGAGQHCQALAYNALCSQEKQPVREHASKAYTGFGDPHANEGAEKAQPVYAKCITCGEEIHSAGQHCQASGCTALCSSVKESPLKEDVQEELAVGKVCPKCGKMIENNDQKWHHFCKINPAKSAAETCAACGKKMEHPYQHCKASGYCALCSASKAEISNLNAEEETLVVGQACPKCGKIINSNDEKWHHVCAE